MKLERLRLFSEVVSAGSFTKAAEKLGLSKAYISIHIKALEREVGKQLLIRNTRTMRLTPNGEVLVEQAHKLSSFWSDSIRLLEDSNDSMAGKVSFTAPLGLMKHVIWPLLMPFLKMHPDIRLNVETGNETHNLIKAKYDFALRITQTPPQDMVAKLLFQYSYICCASPEYLQQVGTPEKIEQLEKLDCVALSYWQRWTFTDQNKKVEIDAKAKYTFADNDLIKQAVIEGYGIARLPWYMLEAEIKQGTLVALFTQYKGEERSVYLLYPQTITQALRVEKVISLITDSIADFA